MGSIGTVGESRWDGMVEHGNGRGEQGGGRGRVRGRQGEVRGKGMGERRERAEIEGKVGGVGARHGRAGVWIGQTHVAKEAQKHQRGEQGKG
jgi:hypothetical protein